MLSCILYLYISPRKWLDVLIHPLELHDVHSIHHATMVIFDYDVRSVEKNLHVLNCTYMNTNFIYSHILQFIIVILVILIYVKYLFPRPLNFSSYLTTEIVRSFNLIVLVQRTSEGTLCVIRLFDVHCVHDAILAITDNDVHKVQSDIRLIFSLDIPDYH